MYTSKSFSVRKEDEVFAEIDQMKPYADQVRKVFLADGNAFVLSFKRLHNLLAKIHEVFPKILRVSAYASPRDILAKSDMELKQLTEAGLKILYVGIESGDDELLSCINKGETAKSTIEALQKAKKAGIKLSVMVLNGLGGRVFSRQHAQHSAQVINQIQPEYLSTLVLSFPYGQEHFQNRFKGTYVSMNQTELIDEMGMFIQDLELESSIFRSDHASNYLVLKGVLNKDKNLLLERIAQVLKDPEGAFLRPEWLRSL